MVKLQKAVFGSKSVIGLIFLPYIVVAIIQYLARGLLEQIAIKFISIIWESFGGSPVTMPVPVLPFIVGVLFWGTIIAVAFKAGAYWQKNTRQPFLLGVRN